VGKVHILSFSDEPFQDRKEAGRLLGQVLSNLKIEKAVVLGIPRGGVIVAREVSNSLDANMDIVLSHKLGAPFNPELAIGAVSEDGKVFLDDAIISQVDIKDTYIKKEGERQLAEIRRRVTSYRKILSKLELKEKTVIITDDGVATGATMQASLWAARQEKPNRLIAALPVGPRDTIERLAEYSDEIICLRTPMFFSAVAQFYIQFEQTTEEEVIEILKEAGERRGNLP